MDVNADDLPNDSFDLVVNHAAGHHVTRIDRLFRRICALLPEEGWFISLDYVGPHRNQYSVDAWNESWILNQALPHHLRQTMEYPLLPLMLEVDASEAVHSELIVETLYRYFKVSELVPLGGALAYPVLTHNEQLFSEADPQSSGSSGARSSSIKTPTTWTAIQIPACSPTSRHSPTRIPFWTGRRWRRGRQPRISGRPKPLKTAGSTTRHRC